MRFLSYQDDLAILTLALSFLLFHWMTSPSLPDSAVGFRLEDLPDVLFGTRSAILPLTSIAPSCAYPRPSLGRSSGPQESIVRLAGCFPGAPEEVDSPTLAQHVFFETGTPVYLLPG